MGLTIRRLDPCTDSALFTEMHGWLMAAPRWQRDAFTVFGSLDQDDYLLAAYTPGRIDIGIFDDGLCANVTLVLQGPQIYEAHLDAKRGTPIDLLEVAIAQVRDQLFDYGMQLTFTWQPHFNKAVIAIEKAIGFQPDNVTMFRGVSHGKLIEWTRYSLRRPNGR